LAISHKTPASSLFLFFTFLSHTCLFIIDRIPSLLFTPSVVTTLHSDSYDRTQLDQQRTKRNTNNTFKAIWDEVAFGYPCTKCRAHPDQPNLFSSL
jgi:hypothetical protein